jgi:hypothetical protein
VNYPLNEYQNLPIEDSWQHQFLQLQQENTQLQQENRDLRFQHANVLNTLAQFHDEHIVVMNKLSVVLQSNADLCSEIQKLKDEIARLKGTPPRPKIPPCGLEGGKREKSGGDKNNEDNPGRGRHLRKKKTGLNFHNTERIKPNDIPEGAVFKGMRKYDVQDLVCQAQNTRYMLERWKLPDGTYVEGKLPVHVQGHYGAALKAHVLTLAYSCRVSEELILEQLHRYKIAISAGQLHSILAEGHDNYHAEKAEILKAAIESGQIQTDDVGTRHQGKNCYTNVICNEFFVHLTTTNSKSRINFLTILAQGRNEYRFNQDAYDYLAAHKGMEGLIHALKIRKDFVINTQEAEKAFLEEFGYVNATESRLLTEAGLFASLIEHGVPRDLNVHSDDAGQFDVFKQSLCWVHEERHYRRLIPVHPEMAVEIENVREGMWQLYKAMKIYKENPNESERERIFQTFDSLFKPEKLTLYKVLNDRMALTYAKRDRLLFVLERPTTSLHNNLSETGGRGAKVKSKISGGTRSAEGRRAWDTFGSLNLTCRRLGICFHEYLMDRFLDLKKIARLGDIIRDRITQTYNPSIPREAMGTVFNSS